MFDSILAHINKEMNPTIIEGDCFKESEKQGDKQGEKQKEEEHNNHIFKLPIHYLDDSEIHPLSTIVSNDLELATSSSENGQSMYQHLFKPKHLFAQNMIPAWNKHYTTNIDYLNDTKNVIEDMCLYRQALSTCKYDIDCTKIMDIWNITKKDDDFLLKYSFIEWDMFKYFNQSSSFLQWLSIINIASPMMSLLLPFFLLLLPFLIIKFQGIPITFQTYMDVLKSIAKNHFIGKALMNMDSISPDKVIYVLFMLGLYCLQIYQNICQCNRFYHNISNINQYLIEMRDYTRYSIESMENFIEIHQNKRTYSRFIDTIHKHCQVLKQFHSELVSIQPFEHSFSKFGDMGYLLKCFYELHSNKDYEDSLQYSFHFEGYVNNLLGVFENIQNNVVSYANFDKSFTCTIDKQYYPPLMDVEHVKNSCSFDKNIIISSPNAGGKTTMIKTTTINIIFSQQIGCGFYKHCALNPYTHIHSYLNIPDTSGRDSLFQAESRRCKEIIDIIHSNADENKYRHFCIFDELYSGTNPVEATKSAYAFLTYLNKFNNVSFILTTHYVSLCKKMKKSDRIQNYKMEVENLPDGSLKYTYRMKKGISKIQGAVKILQQMNYPAEILNTISDYK
jgi:hypothetical protein